MPNIYKNSTFPQTVCNLVINIKGQEANRCLPEQYYETGLKRCFYCTDLCHKAEARDQLSECQQKCPGYSTTTTILNSPTPYESTTYASTTLTISESYESTTFPTTTLNTSRSNESTTQPSPVASGIVQGSVKDHFLVAELRVLGIIVGVILSVLLVLLILLSVILCMKKPERITARMKEQHDLLELENINRQDDLIEVCSSNGCTAVQDTQPPRSSLERLKLITPL